MTTTRMREIVGEYGRERHALRRLAVHRYARHGDGNPRQRLAGFVDDPPLDSHTSGQTDVGVANVLAGTDRDRPSCITGPQSAVRHRQVPPAGCGRPHAEPVCAWQDRIELEPPERIGDRGRTTLGPPGEWKLQGSWRVALESCVDGERHGSALDRRAADGGVDTSGYGAGRDGWRNPARRRIAGRRLLRQGTGQTAK